MSAPKRIIILGATGSIGASTLDIIRQHPERFELVAVSANKNAAALAAICNEFSVPYAALAATDAQPTLRDALAGASTSIVDGGDALCTIAAMPCDIVVAGMVGASGVAPVMAALSAGTNVALANKEALVCAGPQVMQAAKQSGATLLPIDSEHNAAFQIWREAHRGTLHSLTLTASGGPFLNTPLNEFAAITPAQAVAHPNWDMGAKVSVDSATMMNKGLELIEAHYLFNVPPAQLDAVIHPQSLVHAMLSYGDGSTLAHLAMPDMRIPIASALAWPERIALNVPQLSVSDMAKLTFAPIDAARYPIFTLAKQALSAGQASMVALNAANEVAVEAFLNARIGFTDIAAMVEHALTLSAPASFNSTEEVLAWDGQCRHHANELLDKGLYGMAG